MAVTPGLLWGLHAGVELPHTAQSTPSLGANTACPTLAGQFHPPGSPFQPQPAFPELQVPGGVSEEHTWLSTGCNLGALQAGNSEAACSNRHWELDVLTQEPNDVTTGLQWHPYSALTIM